VNGIGYNDGISAYVAWFETNIEGQTLGQAPLTGLNDLAVGPDGSVYFVHAGEYGNPVVLRADPNGIVHRVIGSGFERDSYIPFFEGSPARDTAFWRMNSVAVAPDATIYVADEWEGSDGTPSAVVMAVGTDGSMYTAAGRTDGQLPEGYDGQRATQVRLAPVHSLAVGPDGDLFFTNFNCTVYRIDKTGVLRREVGDDHCSGNEGFIRNGSEARTTRMPAITDIAVDHSGILYLGTMHGNIFFVDSEGRLRTIGGNDEGGSCAFQGFGVPLPRRGCEDPAPNSVAVGTLSPPIASMAFGPDDRLYYSTKDLIKVIEPQSPETDVSDLLVPSDDGNEIYVFDPVGRHKETRSALTNAVLRTFTYDSAGLLVGVIDANGNATQIERDAGGHLTGIIAPFGQRTELAENTDGYLSEIGPDPTHSHYRFTYHDEGGLLATMIDPRDQLHSYEFDNGKLSEDSSPDQRVVTLSGSEVDGVQTVDVDETDGGRKTFVTDYSEPGAVTTTVRFPDGSENVMVQRADGSAEQTFADGTSIVIKTSPDPVFGILSPEQSTTVTLPSGLTNTRVTDASITLTDPTDIFSWTQRTTTETINGEPTVVTLDKPSRTTVVTTPEGRTSTIERDDQGRPTAISIPGLHSIAYAYDNRGRLHTMSRGSGSDARTTILSYFAADPLAPYREGFLKSISGPLEGAVTSFERDEVGRPTLINRPDEESIEFAYDAVGNITTVAPPDRPAHSFGYTPADLIESYSAPAPDAGESAAVTSYTYTRSRDIASITLPGGRGIEVVHDPVLPRPIQKTTTDTSYGFSYDASGRISALSRQDTLGNHSLTLGYDGPLGTVSTRSGDASLVHGTVELVYDANFRVDRVRVNGADIVDYGYDRDGLVTSAGSLSITRRSDNGIITGSMLGQVSTTQSVNAFAELDDHAAMFSGVQMYHEEVTSRDKLGRILESMEQVADGFGMMDSANRAYSYDAVGRLAAVFENGAQVVAYGYDSNGNRTERTTATGTIVGTYDDQDRLVQSVLRTPQAIQIHP
jgi:YD repeat-containing protein